MRQGRADERGGAWGNHQRNARCAYRNRNRPSNHNNNLGVRVVAAIILAALASSAAA